MEMYGYMFDREEDASHHGILGQKWGKRNGPPYPLGAGDHSAAEKKAGWRKSLDKSKKEFKLSDKQRKLIAIGTTAAVAGLAAYGLYRSGALDSIGNYLNLGKNAVDFSTGDIPTDINGIPLLKHTETIQDSLKNTNPHLGEVDRQGNCTTAALAGFCRQQGLDVQAGLGSENGYMAAGAIEDVFPGIRGMRVDGKSRLLADGSAIRFGKSKEDAESMLIKRFGQNAEGICAIQWHKRPDGSQSGHTFSWKIEDGKVTFIDYQQQKMGSDLDYYWRAIDPNGSLVLARLDGLTPDKNGLSKYCEIG